jgi:hypothetical protein
VSPTQRSILRVSPRYIAKADKACPRSLAVKCRPGSRTRPDEPIKKKGLETFADQAVRDVLDLIVFEGMSVPEAHRRHRASPSGSRCHTGLLRWAEHAVLGYLRADEALAHVSGQRLHPRSREWAVQYPIRPGPDDDVFEIRASGRWYESEDGDVREIRLLRTHSVDPDRREVPPPQLPELAAIAFVLVAGHTVIGPWSAPLVVSPAAAAVDRVRIVEIGLSDGSWAVVFDETATRARHLYGEVSRQVLRDVTEGTGYRPGRDCVRCPLRSDCPELVRRPGLLGIHDKSKPARSWSVTTGRRYRTCPAQAHLRDLRLPYPEDREYGLDARRGKAVHHWLEHQHDRKPPRPCRPGDVPPGPSWWPAWGVTGRAALLGEQMIGDHSLRCPVRTMSGADTIRSEQDVVVYDPEADVVVYASVDALYTEGDTVVVRETKSTGQIHEGDLLDRYPQVALALVLAAEGVFGPASRVELERLTPAGPLVDRFSPDQDWLVARAREVVHQLAAPWHADLTMAAQPGDACETCEVALWCPDAKKDEE